MVTGLVRGYFTAQTVRARILKKSRETREIRKMYREAERFMKRHRK